MAVSQGSMLSPVLFTIYIDDIVSSVHDCVIRLYADHTILYCIADSVQLAKVAMCSYKIKLEEKVL